jgi:hypothetical protein
MSSYYREIEACRSAGRWGQLEHFWLTRGIKRRLARILYWLERPRNLVGYDPRSMRWAILR